MASAQPLIAIVGKFADANEKFDDETESRARAACRRLGEELAKKHWRIAVYANDDRFIDREVVTGFVGADVSSEHSIVWYRTTEGYVKYPEMDEHEEYFVEEPEEGGDWNVPIYHSLDEVDGVILFAGGATVLTAGHIALSKKLPTLPIASFRGSAKEIWKYLLRKSPLVLAAEGRTLDRWSDNSLEKCLEYLQEQLKLFRDRELLEEAEQQKLKEKAAKWDKHVKAEKEDRAGQLGVYLFLLFVAAGLVIPVPSSIYPLITFCGLCVGGTAGAWVRMTYMPSPLALKKKKHALAAGTVTAFVFTILYLIPQLVQKDGPHFLFPQDGVIPTSSKVQYMVAMIVVFMAGLGFDSILEQWRTRAEKGGVIEAVPPQRSN